MNERHYYKAFQQWISSLALNLLGVIRVHKKSWVIITYLALFFFFFFPFYFSKKITKNVFTREIVE